MCAGSLTILSQLARFTERQCSDYSQSIHMTSTVTLSPVLLRRASSTSIFAAFPAASDDLPCPRACEDAAF